MDVDLDDGVDADFGKANLAKLCNCVLPSELLVTIVDDGVSGQCQWAVLPLMRQLFSTKREMKLRDNFRDKESEVKDIHLLLWPGVIVLETKSNGNLFGHFLDDLGSVKSQAHASRPSEEPGFFEVTPESCPRSRGDPEFAGGACW